MIRCLSESEYWRVARVVEGLIGGGEPVELVYDSPVALRMSRRAARDAVAFWLMGDAGLRLAETLKLCVADVWLGGAAVNMLQITKLVGKGARARVVPVSQNLAAAIERLAAIEEWAARHGHADPLIGRLVRGPSVSNRRIQQVVARWGFLAIHRLVTPHQLRHTFAVRLRRRVDIAVVQQLLGHASLQSTQMYMGVATDDLTRAVEALALPAPSNGDGVGKQGADWGVGKGCGLPHTQAEPPEGGQRGEPKVEPARSERDGQDDDQPAVPGTDGESGGDAKDV